SFFWFLLSRGGPLFITAQIMTACDSLSLKGGIKSPSKPHNSYSYAQKMYAAILYESGKFQNLEKTSWARMNIGHFWGNPSVSQ
ncbi:hypothetical protein SCLCIDRAFT_121151, partial [Scleroderma citrinum Foug A]